MRRKILNKLQAWQSKADKKPLLLFGARQVGKTYILEKFGKSFANYHLINFEKNKIAHKAFQSNLDPQTIIDKLEIDLQIKISTNDLIIFDEIQECPEAITSLKYFYEDLPQQSIIAAGSLLGVRMTDSSFPVGKVDTLYMQPMSFEEVLLARGENELYELINDPDLKNSKINIAHERLWILFKDYLITGGMPGVIKKFVQNLDRPTDAYENAIQEQEEIINAYYIDIGKHSGKENSMHIRRVLENIPEQLARKQNASSGRYRFKGVIPRKNQYSELVGSIDWLEAAGLVHRVQILDHISHPLPAYTKENFFKLYAFDIGILRALSKLDYREILEYDFGSYKGYIAENFVLQELIYTTAAKQKFCAWNENTAEIELILQHKGENIPIEIKSGSNLKSKSLYSYSKRYQPKQMAILAATKMKIDKAKGLIKCPLYLSYRIHSLLEN